MGGIFLAKSRERDSKRAVAEGERNDSGNRFGARVRVGERCEPSESLRQKETTIFDRRLSFLLFSSLFSIRSSLFSKIVVSREKIRVKREEKR